MMRRQQLSKSIDSMNAEVVPSVQDEYTRRVNLKFGRSRGQGKLFKNVSDCQHYFQSKTSNSASHRNLATVVTTSQPVLTIKEKYEPMPGELGNRRVHSFVNMA